MSPRALRLCVSAAVSLSLAGCGTILYPQRKGQIDGRIDAGVAVLDAVGLLFFVIPGVIAFAVDFSNGTIYLPGGRRHARFDPKGDRLRQVERVVKQATGLSVDLGAPSVRVARLPS